MKEFTEQEAYLELHFENTTEFTLNYDNHIEEEYTADYYKLTINANLNKFLHYLDDKEYYEPFDCHPTKTYWLKVDSDNKCSLIRDSRTRKYGVRESEKFEPNSLFVYFDEDSFLTRMKKQEIDK